MIYGSCLKLIQKEKDLTSACGNVDNNHSCAVNPT